MGDTFFQEHVKTVEMKASISSQDFGIDGKIDPANTVRLYTCNVLPQLEYAVHVPVCQSGKCAIIDRVKQRRFPIYLGVPATASLEAFEVEAGILPLDIRREELIVREFGKTLQKRDTQPINRSTR